MVCARAFYLRREEPHQTLMDIYGSSRKAHLKRPEPLGESEMFYRMMHKRP